MPLSHRSRTGLRLRLAALLVSGLILLPAETSGQDIQPTETQAFAEALRRLEWRQFSSAADAFAIFREAYPASSLQPDALYHEGAALLAMGQDDRAVEVLESFERSFPAHPLSFEARLLLGQYFYTEGRAEDAIRTLARVIERRPPEAIAARALYWMGDSSVLLGDDEQAIAYYLEAAESYRTTETAPKAWYARAYTLVRMKRYEAGAEAFELLAARYPESDLARNVGLALAEVYYELGDYPRAISEINRRLTSLSGEAEERAIFLLAESYNQLRDSENAIVNYRRFTEGSPESPYFRRAVYGLGWNYYHEKSHQWAAEQFSRISDGTDELAPDALYYEGVNLVLSARTEDGAERFSRLVDLWPDHRLADQGLFELGILRYDGRRWEEAEEVFGRLIEDYPNSGRVGEASMWRGNTLIALGRFDDALAAFDRAIELQAASPETRDAVIFQKSWLLYRQERYAEAATAFELLYESDPKGAQAGQALFWSAESRFQTNRLDQAVDRFRRYLRDFPNGTHVDAAHYALGWAYFRQQRYEAAIPEFERFLASYREQTESIPYRTDAQLRLADSFFALKRYADAVRVYRRLAADGDDYALYQIAQAYANSAEPVEAIASFQRLITEFPQSEWREEARYSMGYLYFQNQEYDQAIQEYGTLIRDHGSHALAAKAQYGIGDAHFNAGRLEQAVSAYQVVLDRYPSSPFASDAAAGIQFALLASGQEERSSAFIDSFAVAHPGSPLVDELRFRRAEVRFQGGRTEEATNDLLEFVRSASNDRLLPEAYYYLGTIYADRGQTREATTYLGQIVQRYPDSPRRADAAARLGRLQLEAGRADEAERTYEVLSESAGDDPRLRSEALYGRSMAMLARGRNAEAEALLQQAIQAAPDDPSTAPAYLGLGRLREQAGQSGAAITSYRTAARLSQDEAGAEALYRLGSLLLKTGDAAAAVEELSRMPARFAGYSDWMARAYLEQARALRALRRDGEALQIFDTLINTFPEHPAAADAKREKEAIGQ